MNKIYLLIGDRHRLGGAFINKEDAVKYKDLSLDYYYIEEVEVNPSIEPLITNKKHADLLIELFTKYFPGANVKDSSYTFIKGEIDFLSLFIEVKINKENSIWKLSIIKEDDYLLNLEDKDINSLFEKGSNQLKEIIFNKVFKPTNSIKEIKDPLLKGLKEHFPEWEVKEYNPYKYIVGTLEKKDLTLYISYYPSVNFYRVYIKRGDSLLIDINYQSLETTLIEGKKSLLSLINE